MTGAYGKDLGGKFRRATLLSKRYGISPEKMRARLREMAALTARWGITPTVPTTAIILDRHPGIAKELATLDPAIHGHRHVLYARLPEAEQARDLDAARETFTRHGLPTHGFRAPYLSADETTIRLLQDRGFTFDSSVPCFVLSGDDSLANEALRLAAKRYGPMKVRTPIPERDRDLAKLPVALPDDEILVDGLRLANESILAGILRRMVDRVSDSGSLLVLQIHPERIHLFSEPLRQVMERAEDLGAWRASLTEIAIWALKDGFNPHKWPHGSSMALAVTGDLDAVSLGDFARRVVGG